MLHFHTHTHMSKGERECLLPFHDSALDVGVLFCSMGVVSLEEALYPYKIGHKILKSQLLDQNSLAIVYFE